MHPLASDPPLHQKFRDLVWGQLNFLHTTDNHAWHSGHLQEPQYSADFGDYISFVSHMRRIADEKKVDLLVLDTGDRGEGSGLWDATDPEGKYTRRYFQELDLDLLSNGNHELYKETTANNEFLKMVPHYKGKYIASNVDINVTGKWEPLANRSRKFVTKHQGIRITSFGFLFNFRGGAENIKVQKVQDTIKETWFQTALKDPEVDLFLIIGHADINKTEFTEVYKAIRTARPHLPIQFFGGHSHIRNFLKFDGKATALQSGRFCETVGWLSIDGITAGGSHSSSSDSSPVFSRRYIDANRVGYRHHSGTDATTFDTPEGKKMTMELVGYRKELGLDWVIGYAPHDFTLSKHDYETRDAKNWYVFLEDKILPEMVSNPKRNTTPRLILINQGSQRFDVLKGPFTYDTGFLVSPYKRRFLYVKDLAWAVAKKLRPILENKVKAFNMDMVELLGNVGGEEADTTDGAITDEEDTLGYVARKYIKVPGYITKDLDGSTDGDDTVHSRVARFKPPHVIQAKAFFPKDPPGLSHSTKVDVVFLDFMANSVAAGLNDIIGERDSYKPEDFERYMGPDDTLTSLIKQYVKQNWNH